MPQRTGSSLRQVKRDCGGDVSGQMRFAGGVPRTFLEVALLAGGIHVGAGVSKSVPRTLLKVTLLERGHPAVAEFLAAVSLAVEPPRRNELLVMPWEESPISSPHTPEEGLQIPRESP